MGRKWVGPPALSARTLSVLTHTALQSSQFQCLCLKWAFQIWGFQLDIRKRGQATSKAQISARRAQEQAAWFSASSSQYRDVGSITAKSAVPEAPNHSNHSLSPSVSMPGPLGSRLDAKSIMIEDEMRLQLGLSHHREAEKHREILVLQAQLEELQAKLATERASTGRRVAQHGLDEVLWREKTKAAIQETAQVGQRLADEKVHAFIANTGHDSRSCWLADGVITLTPTIHHPNPPFNPPSPPHEVMLVRAPLEQRLSTKMESKIEMARRLAKERWVIVNSNPNPNGNPTTALTLPRGDPGFNPCFKESIPALSLQVGSILSWD